MSTTATRNARRGASTRNRQVRDAAAIGLALQIVTTVLPLLDLAYFGTIESHVRDAYPAWPASDVALDRDAIAWSLVVIGVLGVVGWIVTIWSARRGRAVRAIVTSLFVVGTVVNLTVAGLGGEAYDTIVPLWLGVTTLVLPGLAGIAALVAAWWGGRE
ncbi:hypothetical protein [Mumia sp. DW29H23]|uniref:hypothetical protein n=1 Tax=Mumia sp. DW29H23 TaxID=3421241 RepID=UPI003D693A54